MSITYIKKRTHNEIILWFSLDNSMELNYISMM